MKDFRHTGREASQGTEYNVTKDLTSWARTKVRLWDESQRDAIRKALNLIDSEEHGRRCEARRKANGATKVDH